MEIKEHEPTEMNNVFIKTSKGEEIGLTSKEPLSDMINHAYSIKLNFLNNFKGKPTGVE